MEYSCTPEVLNNKVVSVNISATETNGTDTNLICGPETITVWTGNHVWPIAAADQKALSAWSQSDLDAVTAAATAQLGWVAYLNAELSGLAAKPKKGKFNF